MEVDIALFLGDALGFPFSVFTFALLSAEVLDFFSAITTPGLVRDEVEGRETPVELQELIWDLSVMHCLKSKQIDFVTI